MIAGNTALGRFLIATPTKCGTTTIEAVANRHARRAAVKGSASHLNEFRMVNWEEGARRQHRMVQPDGWSDAIPFLLVRNPYSRYTSVYEYLRAPANYSQWGAKRVQGKEWPGERPDERWIQQEPLSFSEFMLWLSDVRSFLNKSAERHRRGPLSSPRAFRSPWVWSDSLVQSNAILRNNMGKAPRLLRLEDLWGDLARLADTFGIQALDLSELHSNRSTTRHIASGEGMDAQPAKKGESGVWRDYYGKAHSLCRPENASRPKCLYVRYWDDGICPVCKMRVADEAEFLGYKPYAER